MALNTKFNAKNGISVGVPSVSIIDNVGNAIFPTVSAGQYLGLQPSLSGLAALVGGNSLGSALTIGTNDNYSLNLETGGSSRVTVSSGGNVGIGTITPTERLNVVGNVKTEGNLSVYNLNTAITLDRLTVDGSQGRLFTVTDALTGSLLSVNDISGLPILEVFDDDRVIMGEYASNALAVVGKNVGVGKAVPIAKLDILDTVLAGSGALSGSALSIAQTWNTSGNPTAFTLNVTNSASGASSNLINLQLNGLTRLSLTKAGSLTVSDSDSANRAASIRIVQSDRSVNLIPAAFGGNAGGLGGPNFYQTNCLNESIAFDAINSNGTISFFRLFNDNVSDTLAQRNGVNPQAFRLYNTYTDSISAFERLNIKWASNILKIGTEKGSTGGLARDLALETNGTTRMTITSGGNVGIATTVPDYLFSVKPNAGTAGQIGFSLYPSGAAPALYLQTSNAGASYFMGADNSGVLKIGNATYNILESAGYYTNIKGNGSYVEAGNGTATIQGPYGKILLDAYTTNAIQFFSGTTTTERMRILGSNGNVGIGLVDPNERLTVTGNISSSNVVYASGGNSNLWNSAYSSVTAINATSASTYTTVNANSANWSSVYTTVNAASANYILDGGNTKGANLLVGTNDGYALNLETAGTTKMSITSAGLVGIGIATPSSILDINDSTGSQKNVTLSLRNGSFGWWTMTSSNSNTAGFLRFASNNSGQTPLTLDGATGCVGISNNAPAARLDIADTTLAGSGGLQGSALSVTQTWATSGNPTLIYGRVTNTSSGASSNLIDLGTVAGGTLFKVTKAGNISFGQSASFTQGFEPSSNTSFNIRCYGTTIGGFAATDQPQGLHLNNSSSVVWTNAAGGIGSFASVDLYLNRRGPANLRLGAVDAAAPVAQTLSVQSVVSGTTNTGGANLTITGSQGTGTGPGGSIIFQTAPAGSSGTVQNGLSAALTIDSSLNTYSASNFIVPNVGAKGFWVTGSPTHSGMVNGGGLATLDFKCNAETVLSLVNNGSQRRTQLHVSGELGFSSDLTLIRDATNTLAMRNGINPQTFRLYNTYSNSTTFERADVKWDSTALKIGTDKGTSGGAATPIHFYTDSISRMIISSTGLVTVRDEAGTQQQVINNYSYINNSFTDGGNVAAPWLLDASTNDILHNYATRLNVTNTGTVAASGVFTRLIEWPASELTDANGMTYTDGYVILRCYTGGNAQSVRVRVWNNFSGVWSSYSTAVDISKNASWGLWRAYVGGNYMTKLEVETTSPPGNGTSIQSIEYYPVRLNYGIRYPHRFAAQGADKLLFGGGKSTHAAIVGSGNTLKIRNGNDSADGSITAAAATFSTTLSVAGISTFSTIRTSIVDLIRSDANLMPGALAVDSTGGQFVSLGNCGNSNGTNIYGNSTQGVGIYVGSTVDLLKPTVIGRQNGTTSTTDLSIYNTANSQTKVGIRLGNSSTAASSNIAINFVDYTNADYGQIRGVYNGAVQTGQLAFLTANGGALAETLRITNTGNVGIGTTTPNEKLTVVGAISSTNVVYASGGNSNLWNSAYTSATANNATVTSTYTTVNSNSANWSSVYTTTNTSSAKWDSTHLTTNTLSSTWQSGYTTTNANSANWNSVYSSYNTASATIHNGTVTSTSQGNVTIPKLGGVNESITLTNLGTTGSPTFANLTVSGSLSVVGDFTYLDTAVSVTSALSVVNTGTGPALLVRQSGATPIAHFIDADGTGDIIFANNGFVGLGVASPTQRLTVAGAVSSTGVIYASGGNSDLWNSVYTTTNSNSANYILAGGNSKGADLLIGTNDNFALNFETNGTTKVSIANGGNVGIGTTTPGAKLHIKQGGDFTGSGGSLLHIGTSVIANTSDLGAMVSISDATTGSPQKPGLVLYNNDATAGGWSPMLLFAKKESGATPFQATMAGIAAKSPLGTGNSDSWIDGELHFYTAGAATTGIVPRMVLNSEGNVGIGTINPNEKLTVVGAISSNNVIYASGGNSNIWNSTFTTVNANSANGASVFTTTNTNSAGWTSVYTTTNTSSAKWDSTHLTTNTLSSTWQSGYTTTNANSANWNSVYTTTNANSANYILDGGNTKGANLLVGTNDNFNLNLETAGTTKMTVTSAGNVGIGTTNPGYLLDLNGNGRVTNTLYFGTSSLASMGMVGNNLTINSYAGNPVKIDTLQVTTFVFGVLFQYGDLTLNKAAGTDTYIRSTNQDLRLQSGSTYNLLLNPTAGSVGIGTTTPNEKLTVVGNISSSNVVYASGGNSSLWNSAYTSVTSINASSTSTYTTVNSNSANWSSVYTTTNTNSANWSSAYTTVTNSSPNWNSVYTTTNANSANWTSAYTIVNAGSPIWNSTFSTVTANSANWSSVYTLTNANSAKWDSTHLTTNTLSSTWQSGYTTTNANSANWNSSYTLVNNNNANWTSVYTTTNANSANWTSVYTTTNANSANWTSAYTSVNTNSPNWNSVYTTTNANSAKWDSTHLTTNTLSSTWQSGYTTTNANSAKWNSDFTTVNTNSANWSSVYSTVNAASANYILDGGNTKGANLLIGTNDNFALNFETNGTTKMSVTNGGNVGIGTTTPTSKLEIVDTTSAISLSGAALNIAHTWNAPGVDITAIKLNVSSSGSGGNSKLLDLQIGGTSYFNVDKTGATTMAAAVFVNGGNSNLWNSTYTTVNANSASYIVNGGNTLGGTITIGTNDANNFNLESNGTARISMLATGQVGVGTTTPDTDFVVYKNVIGTPTTLKIRTATGTGSRLDFYRTDAYVATRFDVLSTNEFQFYNNNDVATPKYIINGTNGNFGIGTTSTVHKVTVGGSLSASGTLYGDCAVLGDATASVSLERDAANTLGIRTTTAAQTLNVYGTYTSGTNFERLTLAASATGGVIGHYAGGGGGVARDLIFQTSNTTRMTIAAAGSVNVAGHFSAATKSFLIDHPTQEGKKLQYGVVESNQHSVLVRGRTSDNIIELPEEWSGLVHEDSVTVQLTPIGSYQQLYVVTQDNQRVVVGGSTGKYNYTIYGERKDVDKLQTVV